MAIVFEQVSFAYDERSLWRHSALEEVSLELGTGVFAAVAGSTGSGKSTLLQHFNGILKPTGVKSGCWISPCRPGKSSLRCANCGGA